MTIKDIVETNAIIAKLEEQLNIINGILSECAERNLVVEIIVAYVAIKTPAMKLPVITANVFKLLKRM